MPHVGPMIYASPPNFNQIGYFFTVHVFPFVFGGGWVVVGYRFVRYAVLMFTRRKAILSKPAEVSEQLRRRFQVPHPTLLQFAVGTATLAFICWLVMTGTIRSVIPFDRSTVATALAGFYVFSAAEFVVWIVAVVAAFGASRKWGVGILLGGGVPAVLITIVLALVPQEEFVTEAISMLAIVMFSTLIFCLYGPLPKSSSATSATSAVTT